jgi:hypothetical protein
MNGSGMNMRVQIRQNSPARVVVQVVAGSSPVAHPSLDSEPPRPSSGGPRDQSVSGTELSVLPAFSLTCGLNARPVGFLNPQYGCGSRGVGTPVAAGEIDIGDRARARLATHSSMATWLPIPAMTESMSRAKRSP